MVRDDIFGSAIFTTRKLQGDYLRLLCEQIPPFYLDLTLMVHFDTISVRPIATINILCKMVNSGVSVSSHAETSVLKSYTKIKALDNMPIKSS